MEICRDLKLQMDDPNRSSAGQFRAISIKGSFCIQIAKNCCILKSIHIINSKHSSQVKLRLDTAIVLRQPMA